MGNLIFVFRQCFDAVVWAFLLVTLEGGPGQNELFKQKSKVVLVTVVVTS